MPSRVISLVNLKGGVGKTGLAVNVAVSLAAEFGHKVLLVDLDPQGNASLWVMGLTKWVGLSNNKRTKTVYGLLCRNQPISECIVKSPVTNQHGDVEAQTLDLMPATYHLMSLEENYSQPDGRPPYYVQFCRHIKTLRDIYQFIIIDCPPNIYKATKCAVFVSDRIIVLCAPDALSWMGLQIAAKRISSFLRQTAAELDQERPGVVPPLIAGVILNDVHTAFKNTNKLSASWFEQRLNTLKQGGHADPAARVFPHRIRNAAAFQTGTYQFRPLLFTETKNQNLLEDYRNVASLFTTL